ncbi:hypothetical protein EJ08DRAFT_701814 [Tothia fuscella]|uniref:Uncharacterized protein n=1 Tax=Tothia fuscella TaxID=1048955 RepID=A0A9P4TUF7_9PEZI|nr:hypothetical protein EJ08DRAFT_701814 [Tothia fuscella]
MRRHQNLTTYWHQNTTDRQFQFNSQIAPMAPRRGRFSNESALARPNPNHLSLRSLNIDSTLAAATQIPPPSDVNPTTSSLDPPGRAASPTRQITNISATVPISARNFASPRQEPQQLNESLLSLSPLLPGCRQMQGLGEEKGEEARDDVSGSGIGASEKVDGGEFDYPKKGALEPLEVSLSIQEGRGRRGRKAGGRRYWPC